MCVYNPNGRIQSLFRHECLFRCIHSACCLVACRLLVATLSTLFFFLQNLANLFIISICISLSLYKGNSQQSCRYAATLTLSLTIFPNFAATCYKLSHNTSVAARNECPAWRTIHSVGALTDIHGRISA